MRSFFTILRRELWCAFTAPQAWTLLAAYLLLSGLLTLTLGGFLEQNSADLNGFFVWQPWLFLFLGAALGMGAWSDEYRSGTLEMLLAHPVGFSALVAAKLTGGFLLCMLALLLTAPIPLTCAWLGNPDWGPIAAGYLGCLLTAAFFVAFSQTTSALFRSPFVSFAAALLPGLALMLIGFQPFNLLMLKWRLPADAISAAAQVGVNSHFTYFPQGLVRCGDILWFTGLVWLLGAFTAWKLRRRHGGRRQGRALRLLPPLILLALAYLVPGELDFTADRLWTLDIGSRESIHAITEPVTVEFCYSRDNFELQAPLRNYARRIEALLRQMAAESDGKITLEVVNPLTDEQQAAAQSNGLAAHVTTNGELWFLGARLLPRASGANPQVIPDFDLKDATRLEYTVVKALAASQRTKPRRLGLISSMPLDEHVSADRKHLRPAWRSITRLAEHFQIVPIDVNSTQLPENLEVILLVHPKKLSAELEGALEAFNRERPLFICVDPLCQSELLTQGPHGHTTPSVLPRFIEEQAGVVFVKNKVVADRKLATQTTDQTRGVSMLPTLLMCRPPQFTTPSDITNGLQAIGLFCAGTFQATPKEGVQAMPLFSTSDDCRLLASYEAQRTGADILADFVPDGKPPRPLALHVTRPNAADVLMVADADWLYDSLCFNTTTDQEGKAREVNISDNIAFLLNAAEVLADDSRLLRLRTRGLRKRTFARIEAMGAEAEREIQEIDTKAWQEGYTEAVQIQARIAPLAAEGGEDNPEIQRLMDEYEMHEAARLRQAKVAQRQVLHRLRLKLDKLERTVAAQVVLLLPALLLVCAAIVGWRRRR